MDKLFKISLVVAVISLIFKFGVDAYVDRGVDYPEGPTVNGEDLFVDVTTNTFYTSPDMAEKQKFSGTSIRYHINGEMLAKAGVSKGRLHGPFDSWYENGQKQMSLIWKNGESYRNFKAYRSNGEKIEGDANEIAKKVFSGELVLE